MNEQACRYQGESDAVAERIDEFKAASENVLQSLRTALGAPALPIVQVAITCTSPKTPFASEINALQRQIELPSLATVDATGLQLQQDGVHLTTEAQKELAQRLFNTFQQLTSAAPLQDT